MISLQKCDEWKADIKTFSADLSVEGANISRYLLILDLCMENILKQAANYSGNGERGGGVSGQNHDNQGGEIHKKYM